MPLCDDGMVPLLEKLRNAGIRGFVLLRLRAWLENRGTFGGSAASMPTTPSPLFAGSSGTAG